MANHLGDEQSVHDDVVGEDLPRPLGRYMLLKRIARGGMGEVLLASTMGIEGAERPVIVKIIRREHRKDPNFYARFLDETRVQAQLSHSGVAQVLEAAIDDRTGEPYAVVEHVEGKSLGDVRSRAVQTGHRMAWADAVALGCLMAEALAYIHERKDAAGKPLAIVHRDLSPQNVMVSFTGEVKIIDFGTARGQNRRCHTVAGVVFAKPGYVAPEVANGDSGDARVDLYALGIMLWELCAGRRFLQGDAQQHLARVSRNELNPPMIAEQCGAPEGLDAIIAKLTAFDRDTRYLAARSAATDLAKLLGGAAALPTGERGVRPRAAHLLQALFPGEPLVSRKEFAKLVAAARAQRAAATANAAPAPAPAAPAPAAPAPAAPARPPSLPPIPKPVARPEAGALEGSRYRAIREIGRGASSVVHEVEHLDSKKRFALKVLAGPSAAEPDAVERFRRGARALSLLDHENLVRVHEVGALADGRPFCVMDLYEGETLKDHIAREKGADYREALGFASKILAALEVAHGAGIVHRDVQPSNVLLTADGGLRVLDFGLAIGETIAKGEASVGPARDVAIYGTPEYMAPEQAGGGDVDGRADLYAVGCVLFELVTGKLPFTGSSALAVLEQKRRGGPQRPSEAAPGRAIPEAVSALILKALARHPGSRFQSATEMRRAVEAARAAGPRSRAGLRLAAAALAASAMLALAGGIGLAKSEGLRSRMPARVAALFSEQPAIVAEPAPAAAEVASNAAEPARTTDLDVVPLGEVALDAPPVIGPPAPSAEELAGVEDPALEDPAEHEDVMAGAELADGEQGSEAVAADLAEPAVSAKAAPAKPAHARHQGRKPAPAKGQRGAEQKGKAQKPVDPAAPPAANETKNRDIKDLAPSRDEDASKKKKKKNRLAKAH